MNNLFKSILLVGVVSFSASGQTPGSWLERAEADVARGDYQAANSEAEAVRNQLNSKTSDPRQIRSVVLRIAEIKSLAGKFGEADEIVRKIQVLFKPLTPLESVRTQIVLAVSQAETGNLVGAKVAAQGAVEAAKRSGVDDVWTTNARAELADVLLQEGRLAEARELAALVQTAARPNLNSPSLSANALTIYAGVALADGRADDARTWVETVQRVRNREATHSEAMMLREIEARTALAEGNPRQALELINGVIALAKLALGSSHPFVARCLLTQAKAEIREGKWPEARDTLAAAKDLLDAPNTQARADLRLEWMMSSAEVFVALHRADDASVILARAKSLVSQVRMESSVLAGILNLEAAASLERGHPADLANAEQLLRQADENLAGASARMPVRLVTRYYRGMLNDRQGDTAGAERELTGCVQERPDSVDEPQARAFEILGHNALQQERFAQAADWLSHALRVRHAIGGKTDSELATGLRAAYSGRAAQLLQADSATAIQLYRQAADLGDAEAARTIAFFYEKGHIPAGFQGESSRPPVPIIFTIAIYVVAQDYGQAMQWYRKAADLGSPMAMTDLGFLYEHRDGVPPDYGQSMQWYGKAAERGNVLAMTNIGVLYENGDGVSQDYAQAMQWYRKAADRGLAAAMINIGALYENGYGVSRDYTQAMEWFRKAADLENALAMTHIGFLYGRGRGVVQDDAQAMQWFRKAADRGEASAMTNIGFLYGTGRGVAQDYGQAMEWYRKAAGLGVALAMTNIGDLYEKGHGVAKDQLEAISWYRKAAALGNQVAKDNLKRLGDSGAAQSFAGDRPALGTTGQPESSKGGAAALAARADRMLAARDYAGALPLYRQAADLGSASAMTNIGFLYDRGHGVAQDYGQAMQWYRKAASLGEAVAMKNIAYLYENGLGVPRDYEQAMQWYRKAADRGNAAAMTNIGFLYDRGHGVSQDYGQAMEWYRKAANLGEAVATKNIGVLYENGLGVPQDRTEAISWYRTAAALGNQLAKDSLKRLGVSEQ
jgi:TPR repeat protein